MIHVPGPRFSLVLLTVAVSHLVTSSQSLTKPLAFYYIFILKNQAFHPKTSGKHIHVESVFILGISVTPNLFVDNYAGDTSLLISLPTDMR